MALMNHMDRLDKIFNDVVNSSAGYIESTMKEAVFSTKTDSEHLWESLYLTESSEPTDKFLAENESDYDLAENWQVGNCLL